MSVWEEIGWLALGCLIGNMIQIAWSFRPIRAARKKS